jgi:hypothetical protein
MWVYPIAAVAFAVAWLWAPEISGWLKASIGITITAGAVAYVVAVMEDWSIGGGEDQTTAIVGAVLGVGGILYAIGGAGRAWIGSVSRVLEVIGLLLVIAVLAIPSTFVFALPLSAFIAAGSFRPRTTLSA